MTLNESKVLENITSSPLLGDDFLRIQVIYSVAIPEIADGCSLVGRVEEAGAAVEGFAVGDIVIALGPLSPAIILTSGDCQKVSNEDRVTDDMSFWAYTLALIPAIHLSALEIGERVLVLSNGLVGQTLANLAWLAGAGFCVGVDTSRASLENELAISESSSGPQWISDLGALESIQPAESADIIIDASGDSTDLPSNLARVHNVGRVVMVGIGRGSQFDFNVYPDLHRRSISLFNYRLPTSLRELGQDSSLMNQRLEFVRYLYKMERLRPPFRDLIHLRSPDSNTLSQTLKSMKGTGLLIEW